MKTLHLTIKRKWFDMIVSGEKKEEYRELKDYWHSRLLYKIPVPWGGYLSPLKDLKEGNYDFKNWNKAFGAPIFEEFDVVTFRNGYSKDAPIVTVEYKGCEIKRGNPNWGGGPLQYAIKLGNIINPQ